MSALQWKAMKKRYLQLEKGESIGVAEIIGIFDIDSASQSTATKAFFRRKEDEMGVVSLSNDLPRSFLLSDGEFADTIFVSGLSSDSIIRRLESEKGMNTIWKK